MLPHGAKPEGALKLARQPMRGPERASYAEEQQDRYRRSICIRRPIGNGAVPLGECHQPDYIGCGNHPIWCRPIVTTDQEAIVLVAYDAMENQRTVGGMAESDHVARAQSPTRERRDRDHIEIADGGVHAEATSSEAHWSPPRQYSIQDLQEVSS